MAASLTMKIIERWLNVGFVLLQPAHCDQMLICERNHYVINVCVQKMTGEDPKIELNIALAWAVNAKICMTNHLGFSTFQLVLGNHPNLPSIMENQHPVFEKTEMSDIIIKHLNELHVAIKDYTKEESSNRIKRELCYNVRISREQFCWQGIVYFTREMTAIDGVIQVKLLAKMGKLFSSVDKCLLIGWLFGLYGISKFVGYLMPNSFLDK